MTQAKNKQFWNFILILKIHQINVNLDTYNWDESNWFWTKKYTAKWSVILKREWGCFFDANCIIFLLNTIQLKHEIHEFKKIMQDIETKEKNYYIDIWRWNIIFQLNVSLEFSNIFLIILLFVHLSAKLTLITQY